jgi:hypothetical protein
MGTLLFFGALGSLWAACNFSEANAEKFKKFEQQEHT